jgi:hypothetical protein
VEELGSIYKILVENLKITENCCDADACGKIIIKFLLIKNKEFVTADSVSLSIQGTVNSKFLIYNFKTAIHIYLF